MDYISANYIKFAMSNFGLVMLLVAVLFILFHRLAIKNISQAEIVYRWIALFPLGFTAIYAFTMHAFFSLIAASTIGWISTPFQYEVAVANLAIGFLAIMSFRASYGFRLATVVASTIWLWGDAIVHLYEIFLYHNYAIGNAGSWLFLDIFIPLILISCIVKLKPGALIVREIQL